MLSDVGVDRNEDPMSAMETNVKKPIRICVRQLSSMIREAAGNADDGLNVSLSDVQSSIRNAMDACKRCKGFKNRRQDVADIEYAASRLRAAVAMLNDLRDNLIKSYG